MPIQNLNQLVPALAVSARRQKIPATVVPTASNRSENTALASALQSGGVWANDDIALIAWDAANSQWVAWRRE